MLWYRGRLVEKCSYRYWPNMTHWCFYKMFKQWAPHPLVLYKHVDQYVHANQLLTPVRGTHFFSPPRSFLWQILSFQKLSSPLSKKIFSVAWNEGDGTYYVCCLWLKRGKWEREVKVFSGLWGLSDAHEATRLQDQRPSCVCVCVRVCNKLLSDLTGHLLRWQ